MFSFSSKRIKNKSRSGIVRAVQIAILTFVAGTWLSVARAEADDIRITVVKQQETVIVDASLVAPVPPRQAWDVLTDYEHMADFMPQVNSSKVLERREGRLRVSQSGRIFFGPIPISFDYLREVELTPYSEIRSRVIGGSLKSGAVTTQLIPQGAATRIVYHSEAVPNIWVPLGIGEAFIRNSVREQLVTMRDEMLRRAKQ